MIFLLWRPKGADWEECGAMVVIAETEERARKLANGKGWNEGAIWEDPAEVRAIALAGELQDGVVVSGQLGCWDWSRSDTDEEGPE